jgi:hypothetical protein
MRNRKINVSLTVDWDVNQFLENMPNRQKSKFVNNLLRKEVMKRKNPRQYIVEIHKEVLGKLDEISLLKKKIELIRNEFGITEDELYDIQDFVGREVEVSRKDSVQEEQTQLIQNAN